MNSESVLFYGEEEFVTCKMYGGKPMQPIIHVYGMDDKNVGEDMTTVEDGVKESEEDVRMED